MKLNKLLIPALLVTPMLLTSCGGPASYDIAGAKDQVKVMLQDLMDSPVIKEYRITFNQNKQYFDSVKHTFHTQVLTVDFNEYRVRLHDDKDDHNGANLFQGKGDFWFWLDMEHNYDYHIAMVNDCDKNTHSITKGTLQKNKELIAIKAKLECPGGIYGNPRNYSLNLLQQFNEVFSSMLKDDNVLKDSTFDITSFEKGQLTVKMTTNFDKTKYPNHEYSEIYEFKDNMMVKETYHQKTDDYVNDYSIAYEIDDYTIKLPNPNLFK